MFKEIANYDFVSVDEKNLIQAMALLMILFAFLAPAVVYFGYKEKLSQNARNLTLALLNFEIFMLLVALAVVVLSGIPIIGWFIIGPIGIPGILLFHFIYTIIILLNIANNKPLKVLVPVEIFK